MMVNEYDLKILIANLERETILKALVEANFDKVEAAGLLNIDRKTLYSKIYKYNITKYDYMKLSSL